MLVVEKAVPVQRNVNVDIIEGPDFSVTCEGATQKV
jgi:hypothetical protein